MVCDCGTPWTLLLTFFFKVQAFCTLRFCHSVFVKCKLDMNTCLYLDNRPTLENVNFETFAISAFRLYHLTAIDKCRKS